MSLSCSIFITLFSVFVTLQLQVVFCSKYDNGDNVVHHEILPSPYMSQEMKQMQIISTINNTINNSFRRFYDSFEKNVVDRIRNSAGLNRLITRVRKILSRRGGAGAGNPGQDSQDISGQGSISGGASPIQRMDAWMLDANRLNLIRKLIAANNRNAQLMQFSNQLIDTNPQMTKRQSN